MTTITFNTITINGQQLIPLPTASKNLGLTRQGLDYLLKSRNIETIPIGQGETSLRGISIEDFQQLEQNKRVKTGRKTGSKDSYKRVIKKKK